jgi:hypothetical protein
MSKELRIQRTAILILCTVIVLGLVTCRTQPSFIIVPIREAEFREEQSLPLDNSKIKQIVEFIADGGVHRDDGIHVNIKHEPFRKFLLFFTNGDNLTYGTFKALVGLKEFIDLDNPIYEVIDAREEKGQRGYSRLAYRFEDFWFVFMVDELWRDGRPIEDNKRRFSRLIVMQVLDRSEKDK